ncbi:succinate dehydrogenase, cytochrome b556 subunit [Spectribacter hydrogenoxidans]|uniref:Succinate dehydrogenase cytochrome b556 subunit n=1 Tax=Spectribacter hydrogenoxidans TaxID=3075608 RepID=A0ABU3C2R7_9GAMM|nr:succinate dehydrogenase, cytochrome b556 subunit [Salinisphaera sp. W335]MDT0635845.1 succinate dehydrogenase, cytochrome b556 subunit [Salinisphaera sp. W335]
MANASQRPLSPHLQIYRPQLTSILSISHRLTGVALAAGTAVLALWLIAAAAGADSFALINNHLAAWYGQVLMVFWSFALFYHLCNGIRHLAWDAGWGLDIRTAYMTGYATVAAAVLLTAGAWLLA